MRDEPPADVGPAPRHRLPVGYRENPPASTDAPGATYWGAGAPASDDRLQVPVYRWAARLARAPEVATVVDVGCGTGAKLVRHLSGRATVVGLDQASGVEAARRAHPGTTFVAGDLDDPATWAEAAAHRPDLVLCVDVVEHVEDPGALLDRLRDLAGPGGRLLVSTPDRSRLDGAEALGPPRNPRHVREWTAQEAKALVVDHGLEVVEHRHLLPRSYSPTVADLRRTLGRARRRLPLPDARSCQALLLRPVP